MKFWLLGDPFSCKLLEVSSHWPLLPFCQDEFCSPLLCSGLPQRFARFFLSSLPLVMMARAGLTLFMVFLTSLRQQGVQILPRLGSWTRRNCVSPRRNFLLLRLPKLLTVQSSLGPCHYMWFPRRMGHVTLVVITGKRTLSQFMTGTYFRLFWSFLHISITAEFFPAYDLVMVSSNPHGSENIPETATLTLFGLFEYCSCCWPSLSSGSWITSLLPALCLLF